METTSWYYNCTYPRIVSFEVAAQKLLAKSLQSFSLLRLCVDDKFILQSTCNGTRRSRSVSVDMEEAKVVFIPFDASGDVQIIDIQKTMKLKV